MAASSSGGETEMIVQMLLDKVEGINTRDELHGEALQGVIKEP